MDPRFTLRRESLAEDIYYVQGKVFRRWINAQFEQRNQELFVSDLFQDIKDGNLLCALLEVLAEIKSPISKKQHSGKAVDVDRISVALKNFANLGVELVGVNAADIAEGKPRIILGLVWKIILHFQMGEKVELPTTPKSKKKTFGNPAAADQTAQEKASMTLGTWVERALQEQGMQFEGFGAGWRDGRAFLALIEHVRPGLVDKNKVDPMSWTERLHHAFFLAEKHLNVTRLLDPEDVDTDHPEEQSIMTYAALIWNPPPRFIKRREDTVDAANYGAVPQSGHDVSPGQLMEEIEKSRRIIMNMNRKLQRMSAKVGKFLKSHRQAREGLSCLGSALTKVQPQIQQQVEILHRHLDEQLQQTQSLSEKLCHMEEHHGEEEPPETAKTEDSPRRIVCRLRERLNELKARLEGSVENLKLDLTGVASQSTQPGAMQPVSTQTVPIQCSATDSGSISVMAGSSGDSFRWRRTEQALFDLLKPCVSVATQTSLVQERDNSYPQNLLNDIHENLQKLVDHLTKAPGGYDQIKGLSVEALKEFVSTLEKICSLSAVVKDIITLDKSLLEAEREICLHVETPLRGQNREETPNALLSTVEEYAASAERRLNSLDATETREMYAGMRETLDTQQEAVHYLREAISLSFLETGRSRLDRVHNDGDALLAALRSQGDEPPVAGASADTDETCVSAQEVFTQVRDWTQQAKETLEQLQQPMDRIGQFHREIDDRQLRESLEEALSSVQEKERHNQAVLQQPHQDLRQRRRLRLQQEQRGHGRKESRPLLKKVVQSPVADSLLKVLGHVVFLLLLLYFWSGTAASLL